MINILKASAGTGKTYRLSLEYLKALLEGDDFEKIVVMTFTRKATAEIRERIFEQLEDILEYGSESEVLANLKLIDDSLELDLKALEEIYQKMLLNKDRIKVYTIDSFINTIFKKAIAPYLDIYAYQIIDDGDNQELIEEVFKKILDNKEYFNLMEEFLVQNVERDIKSYIDLLKKILKQRWKFFLIEAKEEKKQFSGDLVARLEGCIEIIKTIAKEKNKEFSDKFISSKFYDYFALEDNQAKEDYIIDNIKSFFSNNFWDGRRTRGKSVAGLKESLELEYDSLKEELARYIFSERILPYQRQIFNFSTKVFEIYDKIKFREKRFTHADISNYTYHYLYHQGLNLLDQNKASDYLFELIGSEVNRLLIDEFQDTSILQWKILKPLIDSCDDLVAVGDEKQAIYSWRGGEKELFARLDRILEGESESLATSYRSEKEIIDFINQFFSGIYEGWDYNKVNYLPEKDGGYVEVLVGGEKGLINTETKRFAKKSEDKQQEIIELNQKITLDLKEEIAKTIKEKLSNYGNVGVLARSNWELEEIAKALEEKEIPYLLESKQSLVEHMAIKPIYFLLRYLAYHDYFDLLKFLRSDLVNINDSTLKYLLEHKVKVEEYLAGNKLNLDLENLEKVLSLIKDLDKLEFNYLANYLLEDYGLLKKYQDNKTALKNIYYFFEKMKDFQNLNQFLEFLEEKKDSEELKQRGINNSNAVKLMTIHKAKGLSFETEFFYWNIKSKRGSWNKELEFYLDFDDKFARVDDYLLSSSDYNHFLEYLGLDFYEEKLEGEFVEEINNLYVALTRAENNLFLHIDTPKKITSTWEGSSYSIYETAILKAIEEVSLLELIEKKSRGEFLESTVEFNKQSKQLRDLRKYFKGAKISESKLLEVNSKKDFVMDLAKEIKRVEGLAIHYYLEQIKYDTKKERQFARTQVMSKYANILGAKGSNDIFNRIERFLEENKEYFSERWEVFNEYQLENEDNLYRIDRLLVDNKAKEILILDYKSGFTKDKSQLKQYKSLIAAKVDGRYEIKTRFLEIA